MNKILFLLRNPYCLLLLILTPSIGMANAGTPLIWLGMIHLAVGNIFIGIVEGFIVAKLARISRIRSVLIMILANYVSAAIGAGLIYLLDKFQNESFLFFAIAHLRLTIAAILLFLILVTLAIELPFVAWILKAWKTKQKVILKTTFWMNLASYILISPLYYLSSVALISSPLKVVNLERLDDLHGEIYYFSANRSKVLKKNFNDLTKELAVYDLPKNVEGSSLCLGDTLESVIPVVAMGVVKNESTVKDGMSYPIYQPLSLTTTFDREKIFAERVYSEQTRNRSICPNLIYTTLGNKPDWKIDWIGTWGIEGMSFSNIVDPSKKVRIAVEAPPLMWMPGNAFVLDNDKVIAGFGPLLILIDLRSQNITPLAVGKNPMVVRFRDVE